MSRIVLVEDDQTMVRLLTTLLGMDGYDVVALDPEQDVAALVLRDPPDFLLLDFLLASQSGLDVLDEIRRSLGGSRPHVIMISGLNVKDECLSHGADEFLLKPFMPDELLTLLRAHTQQNV